MNVTRDGQEPRTYEGDLNVPNAVCYFARVVATGVFAFHIAGGLIHILIIVAVIALVLHLVRGRN